MKFAVTFCFFIWSFFIAHSTSANTLGWNNDILDINVYSAKISETNSQILVEFNVKNGWFILWDNPGDAGVPTTFTFNKPVNRINETTPEIVIHDNILGQYGYSGKAFYLFETKYTSDKINLKINWEACKDECKKQNTSFDFYINPTLSEHYNNTLTEAKKTFPLNQDIEAKAGIKKINDDIFLQLTTNNNGLNFNTSELYFIPYQKSIINVAEKPLVNLSEKLYKLEIKLNTPIIPTHGGILTDGKISYKTNLIPLDNAIDIKSLIYIIALSFLGGIILNFMPCVFPVLSIKALSVCKNKTNKKCALLYLSGVIFSFLSLAGLLYLLRKGGSYIGWGFQLQSPVFVAIMLTLFIIILLMLLNIIKISPYLINKFNTMGSINSFMSGFFAVLIASPCTGPFLGAVLGYTLMQSPSLYFIIFFSLGLGYALPFTLLEIYPEIFAKIMPKSGKWTVRVKYILSIPIIFTCLWLSWVLFSQLNISDKSNKNKIFNHYDKQEISKLLNNRKPVFIEFTAKWCLTCLLNEKNVLDTTDFASLTQQNDITVFRADWTENTPQIAHAIKSYGRNSVPLYVYYPKNKQQYVILPQILTSDIVKSILNSQNQNQN